MYFTYHKFEVYNEYNDYIGKVDRKMLQLYASNKSWHHGRGPLLHKRRSLHMHAHTAAKLPFERTRFHRKRASVREFLDGKKTK